MNSSPTYENNAREIYQINKVDFIDIKNCISDHSKINYDKFLC